MSKIVHKLSHSAHAKTADKCHTPKKSVGTAKATINSETMINCITGYEKNLGDQLEQLEREAGIQAQQIELNECLESVSQLVSLFKHTVILSELQEKNGWQHDAHHHKSVTDNRHLDDKIEQIVIEKGLTREQWNCLLYMVFSSGDTTEITKVTKKHLQKVHDKVLRLLEGDEQKAVFALINAIEKHMSENHLFAN